MNKTSPIHRPLSLICAVLAVAVTTDARADELLDVKCGDEVLFSYQAKPMQNPVGGQRFRGSNFIHPLKTPSGFVISHSQPGDHPHHFGLWWPWKFVSKGERRVLFWELQHGQGIIEATHAERTMDGFAAESVYIDRRAAGGPENWLREDLNAKVSHVFDSPAKGYFLELNIEHHVLGDETLRIDQYRYSGYCLRGTAEWNRNNSTVLTSEGKDYSQSNFSRARWVLVQGSNGADGSAGILMMSHPQNVNHPEHLRTWDPNTHNGAIFVNFNPVQESSFEIHPNEPNLRRYRMFIFDGEITGEEAETLWQNFASQ